MEPFEAGSIFADPDELDTAKAARRMRRLAEIPDVFEDRSPGGDANAGADKDGDLVVEDILSGGAVRAIDTDFGHLAIRLDVHWCAIKLFIRNGSGTKDIAHSAGPVADLTHVNANVGIEGARCDCEGVPLLLANRRNVDEQPLTSLVFHTRLRKLNFYRIVRVADHFDYFGRASRTNLTIDTFDEIDSASPELPSPTLITNTMSPERITCKRRIGICAVSNKTSRGVSIKSEEEGNE